MNGNRLPNRKHIDRFLYPGKVSIEHFEMLIELSGIRSKRVIMALERYLVGGEKRKTLCEANSVSLSYFSVKLKQLHNCSVLVMKLCPYYDFSLIKNKSGK